MKNNAVEKWQSYLADADATGTFSLPGFNLSQPWSDAEPLNWTIKIAVKAGMESPLGSPGREVVTGGMVWIEPPDGLVAAGSNYTANPEWYPYTVTYSSRGLYGPALAAPMTAFFHRNPGDKRPADGQCNGILSDDCIDSLLSLARANSDIISGDFGIQTIPDSCPGIGGPWLGSFSFPFNLTARTQTNAAMKFNEGWVASFSSELGPRDNATDYAAHGSQYVPILFRWTRNGEVGEPKFTGPQPKGPVSQLICVAVDTAAQGKSLPDPGDEYLKAVQAAEDEARNKSRCFLPLNILFHWHLNPG
jgi:hypothetical protein